MGRAGGCVACRLTEPCQRRPSTCPSARSPSSRPFWLPTITDALPVYAQTVQSPAHRTHALQMRHHPPRQATDRPPTTPHARPAAGSRCHTHYAPPLLVLHRAPCSAARPPPHVRPRAQLRTSACCPGRCLPIHNLDTRLQAGSSAFDRVWRNNTIGHGFVMRFVLMGSLTKNLVREPPSCFIWFHSLSLFLIHVGGNRF